MSFRYRNKRIGKRGSGGRFAKVTAADLGIGGTCPNCDHFLIWHYDGDERERPLDPRLFRYRCFTCEPLTDEEQALKAEIEASKPKPRGLSGMLNEIMAEYDEAHPAPQEEA